MIDKILKLLYFKINVFYIKLIFQIKIKKEHSFLLPKDNKWNKIIFFNINRAEFLIVIGPVDKEKRHFLNNPIYTYKLKSTDKIKKIELNKSLPKNFLWLVKIRVIAPGNNLKRQKLVVKAYKN